MFAIRNLFKRSGPQPQILSEDEINLNLQRLCVPQVSDESASGRRILERDVRSIQIYLQVLDDRNDRLDEAKWALRPRLYAILHRLRATDLMRSFIQYHLTDFYLPFNEQTLPHFIDQRGPDLRQAFFAVQDYYLSDVNVKNLELGKSAHLLLRESGDVYFAHLSPLGHGGFGGVDLVLSQLSIEKFARKRVLRARGNEQSQQNLIKELHALRLLHHRHLVQIIGSYTDIEYIAYLMKPVAQQTLEDFLAQPQHSQGMNFKVVLRRFYGCLAGAMNYLRTKNIRHRDLSARNILIDSAWEVYVSDFGSSYNFSREPTSRTRHRNVPTSPDYMAPEYAKGGEHSTRSDMWSLGIIFLEMTSKLLDRQPSEMRRMIRENATKHKTQPYPYANMSVISSWMQSLGVANAMHNHDREPLSWIRELLHVEQRHRLTPPQLMKYIQESPSFRVFCCIRCQGDFESEAFAYGATAPDRPKDSSKEDSKETRKAIEAFFDSDSSKQGFEGISLQQSQSIEQWLQQSTSVQSHAPVPLDPDYSSPSFPAADPIFVTNWDEDDAEGVQESWFDASEFLFNAFSQEAYNLPRPVDDLASPAPGSGPEFGLTESLEPATDRFEDFIPSRRNSQPSCASAGDQSHHKVKAKGIRNSGLGFLEYSSDSSANDSKPFRPFEEISDGSSDNDDDDQEDNAPGAILCSPLRSLFIDERPVAASPKNGEGARESDLLFNEEEDLSEAEQLWHETSDRSDSNEPHESEIRSSHHHALPTTRDSGDDLKADEVATLSSPPPRIPLKVTPQMGIKEDVPREAPESGLETPTTRLDTASRSPAQCLDQVETTGTPPTPDGSRRECESQSLRQDKANETQGTDPVEQPPDAKRQQPPVPTIVVDNLDSAEQTPPAERPMSPISPRPRQALVPVDVSRLMNNIWEMASSAPTSVVTDEARSRITRFFFTIPSEEQIEQVLCLHCQRGSASAVKLTLEKITYRDKKPKSRQFFRPLIYAVKGASSKHNKCVRHLLAAGVNPNHKARKTGLTPLHIALSHANFKGYTNLIWLLLSNEPKANPNAPDWNSERPLEKLFIGPDTQPLELHKRGALSMLLREGADPNFKLPGTGDTPLHLAVRRQDSVVTAMLLYKGADVNAKNNSGSTPLQITANQFRRELNANHAEVLDHLLQYKADVDEPAGALRRTALHWACIAGCAQAVTSLLDAGADVTKTDTDGMDALGLAIENANKLTAAASGGDINRAGFSDHVEIMVGLVGKIKPQLKLEQGRCALETVIKSNDKRLLSMLLPNDRVLGLSFRGTSVRDLIEREGFEVARAFVAKMAKKPLQGG